MGIAETLALSVFLSDKAGFVPCGSALGVELELVHPANASELAVGWDVS